MLNAVQPDAVVFTSGGTEANNWVITSCMKEVTSNGHSANLPHIVTTNIEHDSIKLPLEQFSREERAEVTFVPVCTDTGSVSVDDVLGAVRNHTILITVMLANNETGLLQPVQQISAAVRLLNLRRKVDSLRPILVHTDAAQVFGKLPVDVQELRVDYLTVVGHKFYGPRIGALYKRHDAPLHALFYGGGQEKGLRPGTENIMAIVGLGKASQLVAQNITSYETHLCKMRHHLEDCLEREFCDQILINGKSNHRFGRLPNTTSISFRNSNLKGQLLLKLMPRTQASVGAACHSSGDNGSNVLVNSGIDPKYAPCTLRLSVGRETTRSQLDIVIEELRNAVSLVLSH